MRLIRRAVGGTAIVAVSAMMLWAVSHWQWLADSWRAWQFQPSPDVALLAERAGLSNEGRFYFYVGHPRLEAADQFNAECRRREKGSPILGCYKTQDDTIHIYNVAAPELDGIREVTAAHEMLHAAYARFSSMERAKLGVLLDAAFERVKTPELERRMQYYDRAQPGSRQNELHSILGTEMSDVGAELEAHYRRFFQDRAKVVALHHRYEQTFRALQEEASSLQVSLAERRRAIDAGKAGFDRDMAELNRQIAHFNDRAARGNFPSREYFRAERTTLAERGRQLEARRTMLLEQVAVYNRDVERLRAVGERADRLTQQLDSQKEVR